MTDNEHTTSLRDAAHGTSSKPTARTRGAMWRYESIAVLTPGITPGVGTYLDPAVYLNELEEEGNETEAVAVFPALNRLLIRYRRRQSERT
jgi:hypothetical protein